MLRALVPVGFMLGRDAGSGAYGLVLCSEQSAFSTLKDHATGAQMGSGHCVFAFSAMAAAPGIALGSGLPLWSAEELQQQTVSLHTSAPDAYLRPPPRGPPVLS